MIIATLTGDAEVKARVARWTPQVHEGLKAAIERLAIKLVRKVKQEKLSGQVLRNRTGRLRRSINYQIADLENSITAVVGTNVEYAAIHEYGFSGVQTVREHARVSSRGKGYTVRSFTRNVNMPKRSYLRSSLAEMRDEIVRGMGAAVTEALR